MTTDTFNIPCVIRVRAHGLPRNAVYVGRPGPWGNPFRIGVDGTRDEVVTKHREWFLAQPELMERARRELKGKDLACWCRDDRLDRKHSALACHADILLKVANSK